MGIPKSTDAKTFTCILLEFKPPMKAIRTNTKDLFHAGHVEAAAFTSAVSEFLESTSHCRIYEYPQTTENAETQLRTALEFQWC